MTAEFHICGPFLIPTLRKPGGISLKKDALGDFWKSNGLGTEVGIYVFGIKNRNAGIVPYYVGQTKKTFERECFTDNKINKYVDSLLDNPYPIPSLTLLVYQRSRGRLNSRAITELEKDVINMAFNVNPKLKNDREIRTSTYKISGIGVRGKPSKAVQDFRKMMQI